MIVKKIDFSSKSAMNLSMEWFGKNWPSVYILHNNKEAYIGETLNLSTRMKQHLTNKRRNKLQHVVVISEDTFNKSAILDIESKLIEYVAADAALKLQNSNSGIRNHNYFEKERYEKKFELIWTQLLELGFVQNDLRTLENTDLFKFSPYKSLNEDQYLVVQEILSKILNQVSSGKTGTYLISGEAGTGKTVLAMYLMKLLSDGTVLEFLYPDSEDYNEDFVYKKDEIETINQLRFALVVPQVALRKTLKNVAKNIEGLKASMIIGPSDVVKKDYDLLLIDESHRLKQRKAITNYGSFDNINESLALGNDGTELDWIMRSSRYQIFFYDAQQSIRPSDIPSEKFNTIESDEIIKFNLQSQMRSMGGNDYIKYIKEIFSTNPPRKRFSFENYEFYIFEDISEMRNKITEKNKVEGLARIVAGYAWEWETKNTDYQSILNDEKFDIQIGEEKFIWNSASKEGWILSERSVNEVGSIHTTQGYDLNYVAVIIGPDIYYNEKTHTIEIDSEQYKDKKGKVSIESEEELKEYIINIYITLLSRGIKGTYLYICDDQLRNYMKDYVNVY